MTGIHILQATDSASDAVLISGVLETAGYGIHSEVVSTLERLKAALASQHWQLVVAHNHTAALNPRQVLDALKRVAPELPCIVISGEMDKEAVALLKSGACDFILKEDLSRLGAAVEAALQIPQQRTAQQRAEKALRESEDKFSRAFQISPDSININRFVDGVYIDINEGFTTIFGYTREDVIGRSSMPCDLGIWAKQEDRDRLVAGLKVAGEVTGLEASFRCKDGRVVIGLMSARILQINGEKCILSFTRDITAGKQAECDREATIRLLRFCNQHDDTPRLVRKLTLFFQELTGCEAIGIRLRDGTDFPYVETHGFLPDFVKRECNRCQRDGKSETDRDKADDPTCAYLCGQVLFNQIDPANPRFTKNGSFWTNNTPEPPAGVHISNRQVQIRSCCNIEDYESVALIPLRSRSGIVGLLQFADRRTGRFTAARIEFFEGLADHIATALEKLDAERALRSSEEHLRQVLDTSEAGYFFIDPSGCFQRVNLAWLRLHGYERAEEVIGKHFSITQVDANLEEAAAKVTEWLAGATISSSEFSRRRKDGSVGYHSFSAHVVREEGQVLGLEGFLIDTTGLRQIREEYKMLFEQMLDGFALHEIIFDSAGKPVDYRFLAVNPAFENMTGLKATDVIGKRLREVLPDNENKWIEIYSEVAVTGVARRFEGFSAALGKHFEVLAFRPEKGKFACLIQDVTNRKQLEMQLLQAQKMEAVGQLAGGIAHDFNNILAAAMMHLGLLLREPSLSSAMRDSLKELEAEAKRAANLTRQLLLFSHRQVTQICTIDLNDLLTNFLRMLRRLIGEDITMVFTPVNGPFWIEADSGMIEQVVMNLVVNARDAMPQGGQVEISASAVSNEATMPLGDTGSRAGDFICLSVGDMGCGMDAETLKHIFEPFFTTKEPGKGTGFGLATAYGIVKQHRGWITVQSSVGNGSVFRIFLPAARAPEQKNQGTAVAPIIRGGAESILVVEDDAGFRNMVVMTLKVLGYGVFEATDGPSALAMWESHASEITVLFTDNVMPGGITGLELCHRLQAEKPVLRSIVTTGYSSDRIVPEHLFAAGIAFLQKPFTSETLANTVRRCIDQAVGVSLAAPAAELGPCPPQP